MTDPKTSDSSGSGSTESSSSSGGSEGDTQKPVKPPPKAPEDSGDFLVRSHKLDISIKRSTEDSG